MAGALEQTIGHSPGWMRHTPLDSVAHQTLTETWIFRGQAFPVEITIGKDLDVLALKGISIDEVRRYANFLRTVSDRLYESSSPTRQLVVCPCCHKPATDAAIAMRVFSGVYVRCGECGHGFIRNQPTPEVLGELFEMSAGHSDEYTTEDLEEQRLRVQQIAVPKLEWALRQYTRIYEKSPASLVDVGAGGGHFVEAAHKRGLDVTGYEKSASSRKFARNVFGHDLVTDDFLIQNGSSADLVTFWGLLEYAPEPRQLLAAARTRLPDRGGMLIVEVPRLNCVGSAVQGIEGALVARHMDPTSHVNCFTDASLCTALVETGFKPVAAWYFGMDAYELVVQASTKLSGDATLAALANMINPIQAALDAGRQCDDLVIAAVPAV